MNPLVYTRIVQPIAKRVLCLSIAVMVFAACGLTFAENKPADAVISALVAEWGEKYRNDANWTMQGNATIYPRSVVPDERDLPKEQAVCLAVKAVLAVTNLNVKWMDDMIPQLFLFDEQEPGRHWVVLLRPAISSPLYGQEDNAYHIALDPTGRLYTLTVHTAGKNL